MAELLNVSTANQVTSLASFCLSLLESGSFSAFSGHRPAPHFSLVCPTYSCWARLPVSDGMVEHWGSQLCPTPSFFLPFGHPPLGSQSAWICSTSSQTWAVLASVRHPCLPSVLATSSPAASPCAAGLASAPPTHTSGVHPTVYLISTAWHLHPGVLYRRWSTRSHNGSGYN